ncbi:12273_t:CDS:2, partial [Ambispora leptoticha]
PIENIKPMVAATKTMNILTFDTLQTVDLSGGVCESFTIVKQNTVRIKSFETSDMTFKLFYSPDTYMIPKYIEKPPYSYFDLIGAVGGLLTYAFTAWTFLFGRGKYKSWGIIQRYLLRNSPNAEKIPLISAKDVFKKPANNIASPITLSCNNNTTSSNNDQGQIGKESTFYFDNPLPNSFSTQPKIDATSSTPTAPIYTDEQMFIRRVDARINQKLWFLEQTLSRHYLAGFRLRRYVHELENALKEASSVEEQPSSSLSYMVNDQEIHESVPKPPEL